MDVPNGVNPNSKTWPYVLAFAVEMERQLVENAHKDEAGGEPGWLHGFHPKDAIDRVFEEARELHAANESVYTWPALKTAGERESRAVVEEAADVGNMSMMLACITGKMKPYSND